MLNNVDSINDTALPREEIKNILTNPAPRLIKILWVHWIQKINGSSGKKVSKLLVYNSWS